MHDYLVGYVCGALEIDEIALVEKSLHADQELRRKCDLLRLALRPLDSDREDCCPPEGLAKRCCQRIREFYQQQKQKEPAPEG